MKFYFYLPLITDYLSVVKISVMKIIRNIFDNLDFLPFQFCIFVLLPLLELIWKRKRRKKEKKKIVTKIFFFGDVTHYAQTYVIALQECKVT